MGTGAKPLTSSVFLVLLSLADADRHGLGISDEVAERTGGKVTLGPGTLYNTIRRMLEDGLIEQSETRPSPEDDDPRRRYYRITAKGRRACREEAERLAAVVAVANQKAILG
jgi:DNA-binding PadR family transcriptional regulator